MKLLKGSRRRIVARSSRASVTHNQGVKVVQKITINRSAEELYHFWRNLENLPQFMTHLESVRVTDGKKSHWVARAPLGNKIEWDAEIINEKEPSLLAWRSREDSDLQNAGTVRFQPAPAGRGTEVIVSLEYVPPAGQLGKAFAKLLQETPEHQIHDDLRRLKWLMETGEIPTTHGQPVGPSR